ncbi:MAG: hypothetical protein JJU01_09005 [Alkalibacterium sp.]|nr:hypothetical protein [Alkalibacterium sp.]
MAVTLFAKDIPGSFVRYNVILNETRITKLSLGEESVIELPGATAEIQVKQFTGKSNTLTVSDGDNIEIRISEWNALRAFIFILFTYSILAFGIIGTSYFILSAAALVILFGYFETFKLVKRE